MKRTLPTVFLSLLCLTGFLRLSFAEPAETISPYRALKTESTGVVLVAFNDMTPSEGTVPTLAFVSSYPDPVTAEGAALTGQPSFSVAQANPVGQTQDFEATQEPPSFETPAATITDPLEPLNRVSFAFNDKLYFWVLKPIALGYKAVVPEDLRIGVRNFFSNLTAPVRVGNCLLQARFQCAGTETVRFFLNSTLGLAGFLDAAKDAKLHKENADFGQTLGVWGFTPGFYIDWIILGPSSLRDTFGFVGDLAMDPRTYIFGNNPILYIVRPVEMVNDTSLRIGEYEDLKAAAIDPYVALRDAYHQYRENMIKQIRK